MSTPSFSEGVRSHIDSDRSMLNVSIPAVIESYNPSTQKCTCTPLINHNRLDGSSKAYPTINEVPVQFPASNTSCLTFPINKGDTVLLIFSQRSLDFWLSSTSTELVDPKDFRKHDLSDAIAIPGLFSFPRAINDPLKHTLTHNTGDLVVAHNINTANESEVRIKDDGTIRISAGESNTITMSLNGDIAISTPGDMNITAVGDVNIVGANVNINP